MSEVLLAIEGASFAYGARPVVDGASLAVRAGELVGLVGPNGAGKSTLLRLAAGLLAPAAGRVSTCGLDPRATPRAQVARACALVPQEPRTPAAFTVREAVMMGRAPHQGLLGLPRPGDAAAVARALEACDLGALADRPLGALSGGERRRVFFARALAQEPRLLLLDEPTAFLDLGHQLAALELARAAAGRGLGVLAVLHDLNLAAAACDRLVALSAGRVAADGSPGAVLTPERIEAVWGVPVWRGENGATGAPVVLPSRRLRA